MAEPGAPQPAAAAPLSDPVPAAAPPLPEAVPARQNRLHLSLVWIVPVIALAVGAVLVVRAWLEAGPEVTIEFRSGEGLEAGRTEVRFKEVVVGRVRSVSIGPDREKVLVTASLERGVKWLAVDDTRFWVVRPRIGTSGISGLGTLVSGAYIGVDAGVRTQERTRFTGLEQPPLVLRGEPGRSFVLQAEDLGSLDVGSPVYYRRVRVGRVVGYGLSANGRDLDVRVFVESPYENLVTKDTRFWHASGVDLSVNASGLTLDTQSLVSVFSGAIAFAAAPNGSPAAVADAGQRFRLFDQQRQALAPDDGAPMRVRMVFDQSMRGLDEGAPIDLMGVELGTVRSVKLQSSASARVLPVEVLADLYPRRLGAVRERFFGTNPQQDDRLLLKQLVERGLRAQVRTGNLLTGRLYVALEFMPKPARVAFDANAPVPTLPTVPGTLADVQPQLADIVARLSRVRFDQIGAELQETLKALGKASASLQTTLASADSSLQQLTPEARVALGDLRQALKQANQTLASAQSTLKSAESNLTDAQAPLQRNANQALSELQRAAQALRVLADYLQRHPESIVRGKPDRPLPPAGDTK